MQAAGMATNVFSHSKKTPETPNRPRTPSPSGRTNSQVCFTFKLTGSCSREIQLPRQQKQRRKPRLRRRQSRRPSLVLQPRRPRSPRLSLLHLRFVCAEHGNPSAPAFGRGPRTSQMTSQNALLLIATWTPIVRQMMRHLVRFRRPNLGVVDRSHSPRM